jgi:hypothetical protein
MSNFERIVTPKEHETPWLNILLCGDRSSTK